jgi:CRP-like cAMP-binding protein
MGELGFVDPKNRRTQTVQCIEDADVLAITYEKLLELYFRNPEFGYYFLRLTTERLMQNIARLEGVVEANQKDISRLEEIIEAGKITSPEEATPNLEASR